jgi:hypothetical protein
MSSQLPEAERSSESHCYAVRDLVWYSEGAGGCKLTPAIVTKLNKRTVKVHGVVSYKGVWTWAAYGFSISKSHLRPRAERFAVDELPPI